MALTKVEQIVSIGIEMNGSIFIKKKISILDGENIISESMHRDSFNPNQEISDLPEIAKPYAELHWTEERKDAFMKGRDNGL